MMVKTNLLGPPDENGERHYDVRFSISEYNLLQELFADLKRRKDYEKRRTEDRDRLIKIMKDTDKLESKQPES